jgi:hypothetical protein
VSDHAADARAGDQLASIADITAALDANDIDHWLFGGWAVDFWVGAITRAHDDIDLAAYLDDYDAIRAVLLDAGWEHIPRGNDDAWAIYARHGLEVEFTFVVDDGGSLVIPMPGEPILWSTGPFGDAVRDLGGVRSRVIPLELLRAGKQVPRADAVDGAKDRADVAALSRLG